MREKQEMAIDPVLKQLEELLRRAYELTEANLAPPNPRRAWASSRPGRWKKARTKFARPIAPWRFEEGQRRHALRLHRPANFRH